MRRVLLVIVTTALVGWCASSGDRAGADENVIMQAYRAIKEKRAEYVAEYTETLFEVAGEYADAGEKERAEEALSTLLALYEPPPSRLRITAGSGVMIREGMDKDALKRELRKALGLEATGPSEADRALRESVEKRAGELRARSASAEALSKKSATNLEKKREKATEEFVKDQKKLAEKCLAQGFPAHAYELLLWTLPFAPENKTLRENLLRQKNFKGKWYSAYEVQKAKQGLLLDPDYGWVSQNAIEALKAGKLEYKGKWLPKEKVEELRRDWENRWQYDTEHFLVHTNASLKDAVEFGREVERLYSFFFRVYVDFYVNPGQKPDPELVFGGGMKMQKKLVLHYYRSRESYLEAVKKDPDLKSDPLLVQSAGFYDPNTGKAYFYREPDGPDLTTIYHEVTHQIFGETYNDGPRPPVWMVEGQAVFMEDPVIRGQEGMERLLAGAQPPMGIRPASPIDLLAFVSGTQTDEGFHGAARGDNYATAGAVVHFFMMYEGGKYRSGFTKYCRESYKNVSENRPVHIDKLFEWVGEAPEQVQVAWEKFNQKPDLFDF